MLKYKGGAQAPREYPSVTRVLKRHVSAHAQRECLSTQSVPTHNAVPIQNKTGDRRVGQRHTQPNNRLQVTGNSVRSCLAPAISRT